MSTPKDKLDLLDRIDDNLESASAICDCIAAALLGNEWDCSDSAAKAAIAVQRLIDDARAMHTKYLRGDDAKAGGE